MTLVKVYPCLFMRACLYSEITKTQPTTITLNRHNNYANDCVCPPYKLRALTLK